MADTYDQLVAKVREWSNRDSAALPNSVIMDGLQWAADKAYRTLRVPPLENVITYYNGNRIITYTVGDDDTQLTLAVPDDAEGDVTDAAIEALLPEGFVIVSRVGDLDRSTENSSNRFSSLTSLAVPGDLIEFIQLREVDSNRRSTRVFNEKADVRTFRDLYAEKYNDFAYWTREAGNILLAPGFGNVGTNYGSTGVGISSSIELYYYRRLPALNATYDITLANYRLGLLATATGQPIPGRLDFTQQEFDNLVGLTGQLVTNWLREENERIVLFGALAECFAYLQEDDQSQKYAALWAQEIAELNDEDVRRNASGGNIQMNYNGRGLI